MALEHGGPTKITRPWIFVWAAFTRARRDRRRTRLSPRCRVLSCRRRLRSPDLARARDLGRDPAGEWVPDRRHRPDGIGAAAVTAAAVPTVVAPGAAVAADAFVIGAGPAVVVALDALLTAVVVATGAGARSGAGVGIRIRARAGVRTAAAVAARAPAGMVGAPARVARAAVRAVAVRIVRGASLLILAAPVGVAKVVVVTSSAR